MKRSATSVSTMSGRTRSMYDQSSEVLQTKCTSRNVSASMIVSMYGMT